MGGLAHGLDGIGVVVPEVPLRRRCRRDRPSSTASSPCSTIRSNPYWPRTRPGRRRRLEIEDRVVVVGVIRLGPHLTHGTQAEWLRHRPARPRRPSPMSCDQHRHRVAENQWGLTFLPLVAGSRRRQNYCHVHRSHRPPGSRCWDRPPGHPERRIRHPPRAPQPLDPFSRTPRGLIPHATHETPGPTGLGGLVRVRLGYLAVRIRLDLGLASGVSSLRSVAHLGAGELLAQSLQGLVRGQRAASARSADSEPRSSCPRRRPRRRPSRRPRSASCGLPSARAPRRTASPTSARASSKPSCHSPVSGSKPSG